MDLLLCNSCLYPICYLSYGWFGLTKPRYILPCLTLPVAMGWGARWAYAVAWWEIIWITIAKPNADKRHSSWELRQVRVWIMVLWWVFRWSSKGRKGTENITLFQISKPDQHCSSDVQGERSTFCWGKICTFYVQMSTFYFWDEQLLPLCLRLNYLTQGTFSQALPG